MSLSTKSPSTSFDEWSNRRRVRLRMIQGWSRCQHGWQSVQQKSEYWLAAQTFLFWRCDNRSIILQPNQQLMTRRSKYKEWLWKFSIIGRWKTSGPNVIKLFLSVNFRNKLECLSFVSFSSLVLVRKSVNYGQKKFYNIGPWSSKESRALKKS